MSSQRSSVRALIERIPKAELHLHLGGAIPPHVLIELLDTHRPTQWLGDIPERHQRLFRETPNIRPFLSMERPGASELASLFVYASFHQFLATFLFTSYLIRQVDDLRCLIAGVAESLHAQGIVYAEITVDIMGYVRRGLCLEQVGACLAEGAARDDVCIRWIVDPVRDFGPEGTLAHLRQVLDLRCPGLVGMTIGGSEHLFPPRQFGPLYDLAREHGLRLTVHAGEALGPESVWDALRCLRPHRIGHGVRSVEDPALMAHLAEARVPLEVCPTSNLRTAVYASYAEHPLPQLYRAGVPISLSTDDPTFFETTLAEEYLHAYDMGLGLDDLFVLARNAYAHAFMPEDEKARYIAALEREWRQAGSPAPPLTLPFGGA
ncbi:MAG TPA: adenosine deaminase [Armatimonadota bacterium]|nr:adenosine deaminase [Armatimonadota bacterium]